MRAIAGGLIAGGLVLVSIDAQAVEDRIHAGADAGFVTASFPELTVAGFNVGTHLLYGISDAFNLRAQLDLSVFDFPDPATSAMLGGGLVGAEYVLDTIDWVLYAGLVAGPVVNTVAQGSDTVLAGVEVPVGLSYLMSDRFALRLVEGRYQLLFFGDDTTPTSQLYIGAGLEMMFGL